MISVIISVTLPDLVETHLRKRKVTLKRPPLSLNPSLIENIFCRKIEAKGRIISACLLTIVSGAITSQVSQKMRHNFLLMQIVAYFWRKLLQLNLLWLFEPSPAMLDCSTRKFSSRNTIICCLYLFLLLNKHIFCVKSLLLWNTLWILVVVWSSSFWGTCSVSFAAKQECSYWTLA